MQRKVAEALGGRSVLCALSGGVDSVALLHLLRASGTRVVAAHMEHGIRGENSLRDCGFVTELCAAWDVPLVIERADVPAYAGRTGKGLEEAAREMRYGFLRRQKQALGLDCIATAHHLNDQAETVLMHLMRGCSPAGLTGMAAEAGDVVRPLLDVPREEIERYAREHRLSWVEDETNADTRYLRNAVRRELLPLMQTYNPRIVEALGRLARLSAQQSGYLQGEARRVLERRREGGFLADVTDLPDGLRQCVLHGYLLGLGVDAQMSDVERLEALCGLPAGRRATLGPVTLERETGGVRAVQELIEGSWELALGENETPLGRFCVSLAPAPERLDLGKDAQALDAGTVKWPLTVRTRRRGERVQLLGSKGRTLLSDVLTDRKVPRGLRDRAPIVTDADGNVLWIAGVAACEPGRVRGGSANVLLIRYSKA